jgi:DNA-binding MarR family transcriptional regulator
MSDRFTLAETERVMNERVKDLSLDFPAAAALSSLYRAANAVRNHLAASALREHDLSWTGFVVLWSVWIWDGLETRQAAESAAISKGTLTGVAKTLEARGWLTRTPDEVDRRLVQLKLTPAGEALMAQLYPEFNAVEAEVVGRLSARNLGVLTQALRTLVTTIEEITPTE